MSKLSSLITYALSVVALLKRHPVFALSIIFLLLSLACGEIVWGGRLSDETGKVITKSNY